MQVSIDHSASSFGVPVILSDVGSLMDYAAGIKTARAKLGISAAELGERLGVSERTVNGWEQGRMPETAALNMLGKLLRGSPTVSVFERGNLSYSARLAYLQAILKDKPPADRKGWREVAIVLRGDLKALAAPRLMDELLPLNPGMSGWPIWIDSRLFGEADRPYPNQGGWEAFVQMDMLDRVAIPMVDFWRLEPSGRFYHRRTYEDDVWAKLGDKRGKVLDHPMQIQRVTEALATALRFARSISASPNEASILAAFRWTNLRDRNLTAWTIEPLWPSTTTRRAFEDSITTEIEIPLVTAQATVGSLVEKIVQPLFDAFGASISPSDIQEFVNRTLKAQTGW